MAEDKLVLRCPYHPSYDGKDMLIVECHLCEKVRLIARGFQVDA